MSNEQLSLVEMTLRQLRSLANASGILHYSRMRKAQLLAVIEAMRGRREASPQANRLEAQEDVEAAKFDVGQPEPIGESLASIDEGLPDLPDGYGESRIVLMPRDPQWAYAYWDISNEHKDALRRQGGLQLALRLYDVTEVNLEYQSPNSIQEYPGDELAREWYLPIPVSDRDYVVDIGYRCADGRWLVLARSAPIHVPAVYPSDWFEEQFITIDWEEDLQSKTFLDLGTPKRRGTIHQEMYKLAQGTEAPHIAGSLFASRQRVPEQALSSYVFPSGIGMWSGVGMSGVGMSGIGFSASMPPLRPRQFWLVADAELIVYGATEPDATVTRSSIPIQLNSDGTFRFQMSFQDGPIDFPIMAVAADGEQNRAIHMKFTRETPERRTNTQEESIKEKEIRILDGWFTSEEIRVSIKYRVMEEYEKLAKLDTLEKEKWTEFGFDEEEVQKLQKSYELFMSQPKLQELLEPILQDFLERGLRGDFPTVDEIADAVIPLTLEAVSAGIILIPQNKDIFTHLSNIIKKIDEYIKKLTHKIGKISTRSEGPSMDWDD